MKMGQVFIFVSVGNFLEGVLTMHNTKLDT
jgi:hypothetical protein